MCTTKMLHSNENGFVKQCVECREIQFVFGNCLLQVNETELFTLTGFIGKDVDQFSEQCFPSGKAFVYFTDSVKVRMIFSYNEIKMLYNLLKPATLVIEAFSLANKKS